MDVLFHPTNNLEEAFGNVPVEAMACGIPVVGAAYGGLKDTICHGRTGFLMPTWVTKSGIRTDFLYGLKALIALLSCNSLRNKMSVSGTTRVADRYTYEAFFNSLSEAVRRSITNYRNRKNINYLKVRANGGRFKPNGYLPNLNKPWESYVDAVSSYVSNPCLPLNQQSRLVAVSPLVHVDGPYYLVDDPAFPAEFRLSKEQLKILEYCNAERTLSDVAGPAADINVVRRLVELGLILCTAGEEYNDLDL
jgi:hypothetical protein